MSNHIDKQWDELKQLAPTHSQKDVMRNRIRESIQNLSIDSKTNFHWKSLLTSCLMLVICGGLLTFILQERSQPKSSNQPTPQLDSISWQLKDIYTEKNRDGYALYRKNKPLQVGSYKEVSEAEVNKITRNLAMYVSEKLDHFPYPTNMYIEHMKRENVALRYHFFIPLTEQKWVHFTFDYQQLEFAEIFQVMATLRIKGKEPYIHNEPLYVKHGYGNLIYPVGIEPISISPKKETYHWEKAGTTEVNLYLSEIEKAQWKKISANGATQTFISPNGIEEVTISIKEKEITYEFIYHHQED